MGVYIKGMEMPSSCLECGLRFCYDVKCRPYQGLSPYEGSKDCPLVEVPEPHGRLIDADALIKASGVTIQITGDENARVVAEALESIYQDIEDAQTVIEGSEQ